MLSTCVMIHDIQFLRDVKTTQKKYLPAGNARVTLTNG